MEFTDIDASVSAPDFTKNTAGGQSYRILVPYGNISLGGEKYNESYLAALRDALKAVEKNGAQFVIAVTVQKAPSSVEEALELTAASRHCARRLKDCSGLLGFEIPRCFEGMERSSELSENFKSELLEKHPHYIFV